MNNYAVVTLLAWQTRNTKRQQRAVIWCRDYGLQQILPNVVVGRLYDRERNELLFKFERAFSRKTDLFFYVKICQSCYTGANFSSWLKDNLLETDDFELVQITTSEMMRDEKPNKNRLLHTGVA